MTNTAAESLSFQKISFPDFVEKLLAQTSDGCLVVDNNLKVVAVNRVYLQFHKLYNASVITKDHFLTALDFTSFPDVFFNCLHEVISGEEDKSSLQMEYLGEEISSFNISIQKLGKEENDIEGACIMVQKREIQPLMSKVTRNEDFFKLLIENSTNVYQLADAALVFTYSSTGIESVLGYLPSEMIGKNAIELVHPDDRQQVRDWLIDVRRFPDKLLTYEYRIRNKTGDYIWIENNARNKLADGRLKSIVMNFRNVQAKKVADNALIQAEHRLSLLLNNTEESFIILNSRLRIVTYNKAAQDRSPFFYNQELQSGLSVLDLISKTEIDDYIIIFEQVFTGMEIEKESSFTDPDGSQHIYNHTFRPLFNEDKDIFGVFITSTSITERKKLTEELALHSERLKTAQNIARLGYFEYDMASKNFFCSEQFYEILEISNSLQNWNDLTVVEKRMKPDDRHLLRNEIENAVLHNEDFSLEFRLFFDKGHEKVILAMGGTEQNAAGNTTKFRITLQDITDSKMAMLAIQTLEAKFKSLFDHSIDGVLLSNQNGNIISANPSICNLLGYSLHEITSLNRKDLVDIDSYPVTEMLVTRQNSGAFMGELSLKDKKGHYLPVEITSVSMTDGNNNPYVSTIIRDITEKKKIEEEQKALTEELLKNNQDLQQFSFITSHNLRAPVANLLSLLSLFNKENLADEFNQLLIEKFEEATMQLNQTLNDLINILVIKSNNNIEKETISLTGVFISVKKNIDNLLSQQHGTIKADFSEIDEIQYNRIHVESIFLNMISNAIRYSSPDRKLQLKITSYRHDKWVVVEFADNGLGMDLNRYGDRLFGLYQRFHGNKEGKGLGLYMTRSQVIAMGGKIDVESEPGKGATFKIYFKL